MTTHDHPTTHDSYDESFDRAAEQHPVADGPRSGMQPPVDEHAPPVDSPMPGVRDDPYPASAQAAPAEAPTGGAQFAGGESSREQALFADDELEELRGRWTAVQAAFVDDPKDCVHKADALVSDLVEQLTRGFAGARARLEEQWSRGEQASTEDLRVALMHYREFFERLLAI